MKNKALCFISVFLIQINWLFGQGFIRSELPTALNVPWEITYGSDGFLWISELGGKVSRVDPTTGSKTVVYTAPDYFSGSPLEQYPFCHMPNIGFGTLGLALHPDFNIPATSYIYYVYSYNSGTIPSPATKFKIVRLTWSAATNSVIANVDLVTLLPDGYDHYGGRLIAVKQNTSNYLYFTIGDNGISEDNSPTCYNPPSLNPNNYTQDTGYKTGKIHRFNMDGTIPADNPVTGNSLFTRGHRNPQGLIFNAGQNILYDVEHGDRTDDEINVLQSGKNYGWKFVRGYHADNNYPGEANYVSSYTLNPNITGDGLKEALYSWCATPQPTTSVFGDWCTVAPSDGIFYNSNGIQGWANSLLVVTLKDGISTDMEMYRFKLNPDGISLAPSTSLSPNPQKYFSADQTLNGRLRDITFSPDGKTIYLINNGGTNADKITVYTYDPNASLTYNTDEAENIKIFPSPADNALNISSKKEIEKIKVYNMLGSVLMEEKGNVSSINTSNLGSGIYFISILTKTGYEKSLKFIKN